MKEKTELYNTIDKEDISDEEKRGSYFSEIAEDSAREEWENSQ